MLRTKLIPPGSFDQIVVIGYDRGSDTLFGKDFQKQAVRYSSIQDMHAGNAAADRRCAVVELGKHAASYIAGLQQGPYNQRSVCRTKDGLILVGGLGGVDVIYPKLVANVDNTEKPIFSGLKLFGQEMGVGEEYEGRVILDKALNELDELTLRYYENQFTIQLATDKGEIHNPSRFIYMLEGFSDRWIKTEEQDPNITLAVTPSMCAC